MNRRPENDPQNLKSYCRRDPTSTASCYSVYHITPLIHYEHLGASQGEAAPWRKKERVWSVMDGSGPPRLLSSLTELVTFQPGNYHCRRRNSLINYQCQRCLCFTVRGHHAKRAFAQKQKPLKNERGSRSTDDAEENTRTHTHTHTHMVSTELKPEPSSPALNQH